MNLTVHEKLKRVREKPDLTLPRPALLREHLTRRDGSKVPLVLRPYQQQMVLHLMAMMRFVVGDDTGLGKTVETIAALCQLWARDPDTKAVVLTKKSSVPQWESEFERFAEGVTVIVAVGTPPEAPESPRSVGERFRAYCIDPRLLLGLQRLRETPALGGVHPRL